jgi:hypothetical protein
MLILPFTLCYNIPTVLNYISQYMQRPGPLVRLYQRTHMDDSSSIGNFLMIQAHRANMGSNGNNKITMRERIRRRKCIWLRRIISGARIIKDVTIFRTYWMKPDITISQMGFTIN